MTERLYYQDSALLEFDARVVSRSDCGLRVVLDRTAFYPASGGQPFDTGTLNGIPVLDVVDREEDIEHVLGSPLAEETAHGQVDRARRWDHRQQHTGQHLLSAVFEELYGYRTLSFHMGAAISTIDLAAAELTPAQIAAAERCANELVCENRPVRVSFEDAVEAGGLRKASERTGTLRIVSIEGLDRSACGGTHVQATGEIGPILLRRTDKIRGNVRLEFVCGMRAVEQARREYEALAQTARLFSSSTLETPALVESLQEQARESDKQRRRLAAELAERAGRELYAATGPDASGLRKRIEPALDGALPEEVRIRAQAFTAQPQAIFIASARNPATVLLACSAGLPVHAGETLKALVQQAGGRGGGNAQLAQGSLPSEEALAEVCEKLAHL